MSDHDLIYIIKKQRLPKSKVKVIDSRSMKHFNQDAFLADLMTTPWNMAFIFDGIDDVWGHWSKLFNVIVEKHAPCIKKRVRSNQLPWINIEIKKSMRLRNKLYKKYRRRPTKDAWEHCRTQRNIVTKLKRVAIKRFCADSASNASTPNSFWKKLKPLLPSAGRDVSKDDIHLIDDGKVTTEPSHFLNSLFSTPVLDQSTLKLKQEEFSTHPSISIPSRDFKLNFSFQPVCVSYIQSLLDRIKCNKSCGPDNIMPKILKYSAPSIAVHLTKLLNLYISTSTWPTEWKLSHVTPVFKKDDATLVSNYRPISVLSIIPKILEKVVFDQLYDAFQSLFSSNMPDFLRGHSCCTALIKMGSKKVIGSIAIDLSKAFDSICHNMLLAKLRTYGVGEEAIDFLDSYLSGRKQRVKIEGVFSDWLPVYCGVPQGSLLGPLLFNIFINDINFSVQLTSLRLYADDTAAYASNTDISALELSLNKDLKNLSSWFASNYLFVNSKKTQAMILSKHSHEPTLYIGDTVIKISGFLNILGVRLCQDQSSETT